MFDAHRSVVPGPDHLVFHGLTRRLMTALYTIMSPSQRASVEMSLRDCLLSCNLRRTRAWNFKTERVNTLTITEWATILAVAPSSFTRVLKTTEEPLRASLDMGLGLLKQLSGVAAEMYFFPRAELDGTSACTGWQPSSLSDLIDTFMQDVSRVCRRPDCAVIAGALDAPNLHRLRELRVVLASSVGHVRHFWELWLEGIHQPTKRAIQGGNGRDDAGRALCRMLECEFISRLALEPAKFGVPESWLDHPGVQLALASANPLWSGNERNWTAHGGVIDKAVVPEAARSLSHFFVAAGSQAVWHSRASRGHGDVVYVGGAVSVLVRGPDRGFCVNVADRRPEGDDTVAFYCVVAIFKGRHSVPCAVVQPYQPAADGSGYKLLANRLLFLKLHPNVRRAAALHRCDGGCAASLAGVTHGESNTWTLLGRRQGFPGRSA